LNDKSIKTRNGLTIVAAENDEQEEIIFSVGGSGRPYGIALPADALA